MQDEHPIQVVARRTGLSPHVIRAWERRYHAISPRRSSSNRRVYTSGDIERLSLLRQATRAGHKISDLAPLHVDELRGLVAEGRGGRGGKPGAPKEDLVEAAFDAVEVLDADRLDQTLHQAARALDRAELMDELVLPLMERVGEGWRDGRLRVTHEHLATATIRTFLGTIERAYPAPKNASSLLIATPAGQIHELGALAVAAVAAATGWRVTYLGVSLPAEEILAALAVKTARAVALSITYPADDPMLPVELTRLARNLPPGVTLIAGGRSAAAYRAVLDEIGALRIEDLAALRRLLTEMPCRADRETR